MKKNLKDHDPVILPVDGILDLHNFLPEDVPSLLDEYLRVCLDKGIRDVRIIHGKGKGIMLKTVRALLAKNPMVLTYGPDNATGNWGVTLVTLKGVSKN